MGQGAVELGQLAGGVSDKTLNALKNTYLIGLKILILFLLNKEVNYTL
jgi:hypothetical protein